LKILVVIVVALALSGCFNIESQRQYWIGLDWLHSSTAFTQLYNNYDRNPEQQQHQLNRIAKAQNYFHKSELLQNNPEAKIARGMCLVILEKYDDAIPDLENVLEHEYYGVLGRTFLTRAYLETKQFEKAQVTGSIALSESIQKEKVGDLVPSYLNENGRKAWIQEALAEVYLSKKDYEAVYKSISENTHYSHTPIGRLKLAEAAILCKRYGDARAALIKFEEENNWDTANRPKAQWMLRTLDYIQGVYPVTKISSSKKSKNGWTPEYLMSELPNIIYEQDALDDLYSEYQIIDPGFQSHIQEEVM
jgi:tetratricopeptide (TPR) repeat protein